MTPKKEKKRKASMGEYSELKDLRVRCMQDVSLLPAASAMCM